MSNHTPGPWHVGMKPGPIVYGPQGETVADCRAFDYPENKPNARLIAASPELLAALQKWAKFAKDNHWTDEDFHDCDGNGWIAMMNDAIRKATE